MQLVSMDVNTSSGHSQPHGGAGSQIRSRVTVVCAECKRLKLKCDRRTPCSSCVKRDTVPRCTYSAAAAEKIDVQSLHNRVLVIESQMTQLTSGRMKMSSHDADHALLAVGASGSSVLIPLDDVAGLWLEHLDLGRDSGVDLQPVFPGASTDSEGHHPRDYLRRGSSPRSHGDSVHSSPHPASTSASAPSPFPFPPINHGSATTVPHTFLALLPSAQQRSALLDVLGSVLRMHPSLNFPHFRARINALFADGACPEEIGIGPSRADHAEKPTLSFFAAAAAGFALAIQCSPAAVHQQSTSSPHTSPSPVSSSGPSVSSLLTLSAHALDLAENTAPYDLDFIHALVLRCLCMLHDGMPRVNQAVFGTVGKMVNLARMMGLARDPDEFAGGATPKYSLWEAEMRRRMWWDVVYYDLFISDCMGFTPLISDDQHTCRMPADVDEDAFIPKAVVLPQPGDHPSASNFSYFVLKCRLALLVKSMKKRNGHDPSSSSSPPTPTSSEPSLDTACHALSEIQQYLSDLPPAYRLDVDEDPTDSSYASSSGHSPPSASDRPPPYLLIQRCELVAIANQLVLKLFHPFLRRPSVRPADNAMLASINAAHAIIHASRIARAVWQKHASTAPHFPNDPGSGATRTATDIPSSHGVFYPFARQLFDATIVAAHVVIQAPQSVFAKVALEDVHIALDVLRDPAIATGRGRASSRGGVEGCPSEAVSIVERMLGKAEMAKRNHAPVASGTKRKHEEVEASITKGFWLPYVGTGVATESGSSGLNGSTGGETGGSANGHVQGSPRIKLSEKPFAPENQPYHHPAQHRGASTSGPTRERDKERKYPAVGIRNRANTGSVADRKSPAGMPRSRREPSVSKPQPRPPSGDSGGYGRPVASASSSTNSIQPEPMRGTTGEFSLSAPYGMEDTHMANINTSPTTSRFPPHTQSHPYSTHSFQSAGVSGPQQQSLYDSSSYASDSTRQPPQQSYYLPYQPPAPPPQSTYQPMTSHGHSHSHSQVPQQQQPHLEISPLMGLLPNQNAMDTADLPRIAKQEEGADRQDSQSHTTGSPFAGAEGWPDAGASARYAPQTSWEPGYSY